MSEDQNNNMKEQLPYENCLNCGTELNGLYCHKCGQKATSATPKVKEFILEYAGHAYIWDTKFFSTIWTLVKKPGLLTQEFCKGRFASYMHPLKLNMFLLLLFVTIFLIFSDPESSKDKISNLDTSEDLISGISLSVLQSNDEYMEKLVQSPKDTVTIVASLELAEMYPEIMSVVAVEVDNPGNELDVWAACLPELLLDDKVLESDEAGRYHFSSNSEVVKGQESVRYVGAVWRTIMESISKYFAIFILLTVPILALIVRLVVRNRKFKFFNHFIFALHYTAVVELLVLIIYVMYLLFEPSNTLLQLMIVVFPLIYLIFALKRFYEVKYWRAITKSVFISGTYILICGILAFIALLVVLVSVAISMI